jgi:hypothetical protein
MRWPSIGIGFGLTAKLRRWLLNYGWPRR